MSFTITKIDDSKLQTVENVAKRIQTLDLTTGNLRWWLNQKTSDPLAWKGFKRVLPKIDVVPMEEANSAQVAFIQEFDPHYHTLLQAMSYSTTSAADFGPSTAASVLCMMNQLKLITYDLHMGPMPTFVPTICENTKAEVPLCRGFCIIPKPFVAELKKATHKTVQIVSPLVINFAVQVALTQQFDYAGKIVSAPIVPIEFDIGDHFKQGRMVTNLGRIAAMLFSKNTKQYNGIDQVTKMIFSKAQQLQPHLRDLKEGQSGPDIKQLHPEIISFGRRNFDDIALNDLHSYAQKFWNAVGKRKAVFKIADNGDKSINVSAKFSPVMSLISGSPFEFLKDDTGNTPIKVKKGFKISMSCCYFGAGGNRGRQVFDNRFVTTAYDIKEPKQHKDPKTEKEFRNYGLKTWIKKDVYGFNEYKGFDVFVSDIYMDVWNQVAGPDPRGHIFVSNALRGKILNDMVIVTENLPRFRVVKGFVPDATQMKLYIDALPFAVCDTSRACTTELLYVKFAKQHPVDAALAALIKDYGPKGSVFGDRVRFVKTIEEFEVFCRIKLINVIKELNFQIRSLPLSFKCMIGSPRNRTWWIASDDLPKLYVPKKFGLDAHHGTHTSSDIFADLYNLLEEDKMLDDDDLENFMASGITLSAEGDLDVGNIDMDKKFGDFDEDDGGGDFH